MILEPTGRMEIPHQEELELEFALSLLAEVQSQGKTMEESRASLVLLFQDQVISLPQ